MATADAGPPPILATLPGALVVQTSGMPDALAADVDGVFWTTADNVLWALDVGSTTPRLLSSASPMPYRFYAPSGRLGSAGHDLFWLAGASALTMALHRTSKAGAAAGDDLLAQGVRWTDNPSLATDDARVYWVEGEGSFSIDVPGSLIRALPRAAEPGTAPDTLVTVPWPDGIFSIAVAGGILFYSSVPVTGTTMFFPAIFSLDFGVGETNSAALGSGTDPRPDNGDLYFVRNVDPWHPHLMRAPGLGAAVNRTIDLGQIEGAEAIDILDQWALLSVPSSSSATPDHKLIAVRTTGLGHVVPLADNLGTSAVLGGGFLAYADLQGQLHVFSYDQIRAVLATVSGN